MNDLLSDIVDAGALTAAERDAMFALMDLVYDGVDRANFERDLADKDECIVLRTPYDQIVGFSTQKRLVVEVPAGGRPQVEHGIFSGDTVIHPDYWGSAALMQAFSRRYIASREKRLWWFLVSKGHRTYRFLPTFFTTFWPDRRTPTPADAQALMDAYASALYPADYEPTSGVLAYRTPKDRLRPGLAGVTDRDLRNPDVAFFAARNPGHERGHDLVCLCELSPDNLKPRMRPLLLGEP